MKRSLFSLLALAILYMVPARAQKQNHNFEVAKNLEIFNTVYKNLDLMFVDTLSADTLLGNTMMYMLRSLDPFTEYFDEEDAKKFDQQSRGKYAGIGSLIHYDKESQRVRIAEPYEGSPAATTGLRAGDILQKINGKDVKGLLTPAVSNLLMGDPGTTVTVTVARPGQKKHLTFTVVRQTIHLPHVLYSGMLKDGQTGYIYLQDFLDNSYKEVLQAFTELKAKGAKRLILDLRGNGGGLLTEAVNIVNLFVPRGKTIVEMKGKISAANAVYKTLNEPVDLDMPVVCLVNNGTASAAEITSGALQDLDRAVVVGARTYGKGLVQRPIDLPYNTKMKLTISKYYIPSGRCIQAYDYRHTDQNGYLTVPDSLTKVFHTAGGRVVRDGGGIKPDITTKQDSIEANTVVYYLALSELPLDYACRYTQKHHTVAQPEVFRLTDEDFADFVALAKEKKFSYDTKSVKMLKDLKRMAEAEGCYKDSEAEFAALEKKLEQNLERDLYRFKKEIKDWLSLEIMRMHYYQKGGVLWQLQDDKDVEEALRVLNTPKEYQRILGK